MAKKKTNQPARLQEALVLHKYILKLFGCNDLEGLGRDLKDPSPRRRGRRGRFQAVPRHEVSSVS